MTNRYKKYPRTFHLPWSEGITSDDKVLKDLSSFKGKNVICTLKMDGENTSMYMNKIHARSIDSKDHPSRHWVKQFHAGIRYQIPQNWRICGENLFAKHSIFYRDLPSYFLGISIFDENNFCLSWEETLIFFEIIGIHPVQEIYSGKFDEKLIKKIDTESNEGYVIRNAEKFHYNDFSFNVAKFVRKNHVQTSTHWMREKITPNKLKEEKNEENTDSVHYEL